MEPCSVLAANEPLVGTAPHVVTWLIVEHAGPWSAQAPQTIPEFAALKGSGITPLFARRPNARRHGHRYWIAREHGVHTGCGASVSQLVAMAMDEHLELSDDVNAIFICTNGARDACCATIGRKLSTAFADDERVWECTHLGGHRFAPTALELPSGNVYGRLEHLEFSPAQLRGNSYLEPRAQAAAILGTDALVEVPISARPESCGGPAKPGSYFAISSSTSR